MLLEKVGSEFDTRTLVLDARLMLISAIGINSAEPLPIWFQLEKAG